MPSFDDGNVDGFESWVAWVLVAVAPLVGLVAYGAVWMLGRLA